MLRGFRKLVDIPADQQDTLTELSARLTRRSIFHCQTNHHATPESSGFARIYVYGPDIDIAREELRRLKKKEKDSTL